MTLKEKGIRKVNTIHSLTTFKNNYHIESLLTTIADEDENEIEQKPKEDEIYHPGEHGPQHDKGNIPHKG